MRETKAAECTYTGWQTLTDFCIIRQRMVLRYGTVGDCQAGNAQSYFQEPLAQTSTDRQRYTSRMKARKRVLIVFDAFWPSKHEKTRPQDIITCNDLKRKVCSKVCVHSLGWDGSLGNFVVIHLYVQKRSRSHGKRLPCPPFPWIWLHR